MCLGPIAWLLAAGVPAGAGCRSIGWEQRERPRGCLELAERLRSDAKSRKELGLAPAPSLQGAERGFPENTLASSAGVVPLRSLSVPCSPRGKL